MAFFGYIFAIGALWRTILRRVFGFSRDWTTRILGWFAAIFFLSLVSSVFAVWYRITKVEIVITYLLILTLTAFLYWITRNWKLETRNWESAKDNFEIYSFKKNQFLVFSFLFLCAVEIYLLFISKNPASLFSPWQTINHWYLPVFFLFTALLGRIIFSGYKTKTILACVILHSIVLHAYLPLTHVLPWGGDTWRHIGVERKLLGGESYPPILFGTEAKYRDVEIRNWKLEIPEAILIPNKYAYGQLWGLSVLIAKTTGLSLETIAKWLAPALWSLVFPIILWHIGSLLFSSRRYALWLAALGALPFSWQTLGSLSFPVSLGYLSFFFILMLWLMAVRSENRFQRGLVYLVSALMLFGYTLHFLLLWIVIIGSGIFRRVSATNKKEVLPLAGVGKEGVTGRLYSIAAYTGALFLSMFILPVFEMITKISHFSASWDAWHSFKQFIGQFSGWFYASMIRPHAISSGNFLFFHTPAWAYVNNFFTAWRWWIIPAMAIIWGVVLYGLAMRMRELYANDSNSRIWNLIVLLFSIVVGGYVIGWFVLDGDRTFIRRLDGMMAFVIVIFFLAGIQKISSIIYHLSSACNLKPVTRNLFVLATIAVFAWVTTATYASGPDQRVASRDEYQAASYAWHELSKLKAPHCVLADTWPLLALEGISGRAIIGGGFPIDYQFGQPERVVLFGELRERPRQSILKVAKKLTGAEYCVAFLPSSEVDAGRIKQIDALFGKSGVNIGSILVWIEANQASVR